MYGAPAQYAAPIPQTFSVPVTYAAPSVTMLGAGAVIPPSPFGLMLGHIGRKLEMHSWPRVQPMMAAPAMQQTVYLQVAQPQVMQAVYSVPAPQYQAPPMQYGAPQPPQKNPPQQYQAPPTYGSPQAPQGGGGMYGAPRPNPASEAAPPVPKA